MYDGNYYMEGIADLNLFTTEQAERHISTTSNHSAPLALATRT